MRETCKHKTYILTALIYVISLTTTQNSSVNGLPVSKTSEPFPVREKNIRGSFSNKETSTRKLQNTSDEEFSFDDIKLEVLPFIEDDAGISYEQCDHLAFDLEQALKEFVNHQVQNEMEGIYYYETSFGQDSEINNVESSFETNNQHKDIEEADFVKSDGTFMYVVYGREIIMIDLKGNEKDRLNVDLSNTQSITGLLLYEDRLVATTECSSYILCDGSYKTQIVIVNIDSSYGRLSIAERTKIKGKLKDVRMIESNVHLVTKMAFDLSQLRQDLARKVSYELYYISDDEAYAKLAFESVSDQIPELALQILQDQILQTDNLAPDACKNIVKASTFFPETANEDLISSLDSILQGFVEITSFDIKEGFNGGIDISGTFSISHTDIYANNNFLFVGESNGWSLRASDDAVTYITAFQLDGAAAIPTAFGSVPGCTLNQFSYDFYNDHLRIATTIGSRESSTNQVVVSKIEGNDIKIVGIVEGLGNTEVIYAARYVNDYAFIVTFRQIDPFYIVDLSVPEAPVLKGELKIPGFSNYLHPIDDNYILAVGQDIDESTGDQLGLQVALFDVTDLSNPQQISKHVVKGWSSSESQHDHHAFRYLPSSKKLILPISRNSDIVDKSFDGFYVFNIDPDLGENSITKDFEVMHFDAEEINIKCYSPYYLKARSLVFDGNMVTLKGHSIQSHNLESQNKLFNVELDTYFENLIEEDTCHKWFGESIGSTAQQTLWQNISTFLISLLTSVLITPQN